MKNGRVLFAISVLIVAAMVTVGLAYALWSKTLLINGQTQTGKLNVGFESFIISDNEASLPEPKDVGQTTAELIDLDGDGVYDKIVVTITNAYPSYEAYVDCIIKNYGTIPAIIQDINVNAPPELTVEINWFIYEGMQIDPGDGVMAEIYVHVLQGASQSSTYTFTGTIDFIQWNEYTP
jgi:hypothetical protein